MLGCRMTQESVETESRTLKRGAAVQLVNIRVNSMSVLINARLLAVLILYVIGHEDAV
jgi:hypothetical protein